MSRARTGRVLALSAALSLLLAPLSSGTSPTTAAALAPTDVLASAPHPLLRPAEPSSPPTTATGATTAQDTGTTPQGEPADDDPDLPALTLTRLSPVVAGPGDPVTVSGLLDVDALGLDLSAAAPSGPSAPGPDDGEATTPPALSPVATMEVRLGPEPPTQRSDVAEWVEDTSPSEGRVLATAQVVTAPDPTVDRIPFSVTIEDLGPPTAYGVLPVSVEVSLPSAAQPAAVVHTFLPFQVRKEYEPLDLAWVVPLTVPADPALVAELGPERTAAWEALLGESGALRERLAAATVPGVVWALDPALLGPGPEPAPSDESEEGGEGDGAGPTAGPTDATATGSAAPSGTSPGASPSTTLTPAPGTTAEGPGGETTDEDAVTERTVRAAFAELLLAGATGRDVLLLPTHDTDVAALPGPDVDGETAPAVRSLIRRGLDVADAATLLTDAGATVTRTAWPAGGGWSVPLDASLRELSGDEAWSVLASTTSVESSGRGPFASPTGGTVVPYDAGLSSRADTATAAGQALPAALAMAADSLVLLNERPGTPRRVTVALDRAGEAGAWSADLTAVLDQVPWLARGGLDGLGEPTETGRLVPETPPPPVPTLLADGRARDLATAMDLLPVAASVRAETGAELAARGADTLAHLTSVRWRGHGEDWSTAYDPIAADVAETFTGLTIPSRDIAFLADSGLLRVAVENSLDTDIDNATLDLTVEHPILRVESGPQPVEVGAGSRSTVGFQATAIASGRVSVTATLRAPDGTVLGEPTVFSVRVSPTSDWIYWVLGGVAGAVIAIGVARTVLRRRPST